MFLSTGPSDGCAFEISVQSLSDFIGLDWEYLEAGGTGGELEGNFGCCCVL